MNTTLIIILSISIVALAIAIFIIRRHVKNLKVTNEPPEDTNKLYRDWIFAVYFENDDLSSPKVVYCNIHSVQDNKTLVDCPSMGPDEQTVYWVPERNNYFFESQLQLLKLKQNI